MNSEAAIEALFSINETKSIDGYELATLRGFISHEDEGVREEAALVLGIRLKLEDIFLDLLYRLNDVERSESVLPVLIDAVVLLLQRVPAKRAEVLRLLAKITLDETKPGEVRGAAYLGILRTLERMTAREFAMAPLDIDEMNVDAALISSLLIN